MNTSPQSDAPGEMSREEMISALFAQLVLQQANLALMLLGRVPHPQTGKTEMDVEAAKSFIDQLEMLEIKTKGNLSAQEASLLKDALMSVRMAFVQAVKSAEAAPSAATPGAPDTTAASAESGGSPSSEAPPAQGGEESRKKFAKKY